MSSWLLLTVEVIEGLLAKGGWGVGRQGDGMEDWIETELFFFFIFF